MKKTLLTVRTIRLLIGICLLLVPFFGISQNERACFSVPGGFNEESLELELFPFYAYHHIRYTTNGNRPTAQSTLYTGPLALDEGLYSTSDIYTIQVAPEDMMYYPDSVRHCIVIRAAVYDENDSCISEVATNSYFIRSLGCDTHGLPVVSLCSDSLGLFDYEHGILVPGVWFDPEDPNYTGNYYQQGFEWERVANVEYYEQDNTGINQQAGLRTHGGGGRRYQQKSLKICARDEYGKGHFEYPFFPELPVDRFKKLTFKPFSSSWKQSGVADYVCNRLAKGLNFESLSSKPVVLFLNGEYWGLYFIHEKPDEHYLKEHFGLSTETLHLYRGWNPFAEYGSGNDFVEFRNWLTDADLSLQENWEQVCLQVDIPCFIDYEIFELFIENLDWPANNVRFWHLDGEPWRWIFFDGDAGLRYGTLDVFANATYVGPETWPSSTIATLLFRKFMENSLFQEAFYDRFEQLFDSAFSYAATGPCLSEIRATIEEEVPLQVDRFHFPESMERWNYDMGGHEWFLLHRVDLMREMIQQFVMGLDEIREDSKVYPNPSDGIIRLEINAEAAGEAWLRIDDLLGRRVFQQTVTLHPGVNMLTIDPSLSSGVYVLKMPNFVAKIVRK